MRKHSAIEDEFALKMQQKNRELTQRVELLTARETHMSDLEKQVSEMPVLIEKAEKKGVAIAEGRLTKEFEHRIQLLEMTAANDAKVAAQNAASLSANIAHQALQIEAMRTDLTAANLRAETIAAKALEASSGQQALAVAMQSAANRDNGLGNGKRT